MDNTTNPEVELDNTTTTESSTVNEEVREHDEVSALKAKVAILERHLKKTSGNTIDKETLEKVNKLAEKQTISEFAEENGISLSQAKELFAFKPDLRKEDLNTPIVKSFVENQRRTSRVENNTPGSNIGSSENTDFWKMDRSERIKAFEKTFKR